MDRLNQDLISAINAMRAVLAAINRALSTWRQNRSIRILLPQPVVVSARLELLHLGVAKKK
jgi:hypothetical protein